MADDNTDYWFVPKLYGLGFTPVTWQGWALTIGFVAAVIAARNWLPTRTEQGIVILMVFAAYLAIAAGKTRDGLRWRWGSEDGR